MGLESTDRTTVAVVVDIPSRGVPTFQEYERSVLPMLADHGGRLAHRWRNGDGTFEIHILEFESRTGLESYLSDDRRATHEARLDASGAQARVTQVEQVEDRANSQ